MKIPLKAYWNLLRDYLVPQWRWALVLTVLILAGIGLQLTSPQIMRRFIDTTQGDGDAGVLLRSALAFVGVALAQQLSALAATWVSENVGWTATNELRADLTEHCLRLDMSFHNTHTPGEMIERVDGDVNALANFFAQFAQQVLGNILLLVGVLISLFVEDWRVGAVFALFAVAALALMLRLRGIAVPHWKAEREASAEQFGFLEERLAGTEDIRSSGAKDYVLRSLYVLMRSLMEKTRKAALMVSIMVNSSMVLFAIGNAAGLAVGAYLFLDGRITIGTAVLIGWYASMISWPIQRIANQMQELQRAGAGIARIRELLDVRTRIDECDGECALPTGGALSLTFDHVTFGYQDAKKAETKDESGKEQETDPPPEKREIVLHDISFHLEPGTILGLLGRTGSGKTTLTRLVFRLYDADQGAVRLSQGKAMADVRELSLGDLRKRVGMVTQNIQLFNASVRDNLTFFDKSIPDEHILQVIHDLELGEWFDALPHGLDTELESGGGGLSAGEQQLLAFTRIFLQDPGLVILDEASSRLDPATEHLIERAVDRLVQDRTAIVIAHRLGTVQRADQIMILDSGQIVEYGPRAGLAADVDSRFYHLLQTGLEQVLV